MSGGGDRRKGKTVLNGAMSIDGRGNTNVSTGLFIVSGAGYENVI